MKTPEEIQALAQSIVLREFDRRVEYANLRLPRRCIHNHRQQLDPRKDVEDLPNASYNRVDRRHLPVVGEMGLCMYGAEDPEQWPGDICEDPIDAQRCPLFTPYQDKASLLAEFADQLSDSGWIETNLPDLHALLWVLEDTPRPKLPWWRRLSYWFHQIEVEPVRKTDVLSLLPPK